MLQAACSMLPVPDSMEEVELELKAEDSYVRSEGVGLTRENPYPIGELVTSVPGWHFRVMDLLRGQAAYEVMNSGNDQFDLPPEGLEYVLVKLFVRRTAQGEYPVDIGLGELGITGSNHVVYLDQEMRWPQPEIFFVDMFTAEKMETWIDVIMPVDEDNLMVVVDIEDWETNERHTRFLAVDEGAMVSVSCDPFDQESNDIGINLENPARHGELLVMEHWKVTLLNTIRGESVMDFIHEYDPNHRPPDEGTTYLLAQFRLSYFNREDKPYEIFFDNFSLVDREGSLISSYRTRRPQGGQGVWLNQVKLLPGAEIEGWVVFVVPEDTSDPIVQVNLKEAVWAQNGNALRYIQINTND